MGLSSNNNPVKLVTSFIYKDEACLEQAEKSILKRFGEYEPLIESLPFDYTDYYNEEFGEPLKRKLVAFKKLVKIDKIYKVKQFSNKIENRLKEGGKRRVNIDPGYVTEAKLVLLTTKDYTHRLYVGGKIFAETTLYYQNDAFRAWPWTYPDYASDELRGYFEKIRDIYVGQIKNTKIGHYGA